jgi:hypothetical protein
VPEKELLPQRTVINVPAKQFLTEYRLKLKAGHSKFMLINLTHLSTVRTSKVLGVQM